MLIPPLTPAFISRKRNRAPTSTTPTGPLVLQAAVFDRDSVVLRLTFDRPLDVNASTAPGEVTIADGDTGVFRAGVSGSYPSANQIEFTLAQGDVDPDPGVTMTASAFTGIKGTDGNTWAGVTAVALPYGA